MSRVPRADVVVTVTSRSEVAEDIAVVEMVAAEGYELPSWEPGAHVDVLLPSGLVRQYSLCGEPTAPVWRLGVLREAHGRGGSRQFYDLARPGATLRLAGPRTHFAFESEPGRPVVFVAGGIGITPIAAMAAAAAREGVDYRLLYLGHSRGRLALLPELAERHGDRLELHISDEGGRLDVAAMLSALEPGAAVYACGPASLLDELEAAAEERGIELRMERFEASALSAPVWDGPFEVELAASGLTIEVPPEKSVLAAIEEQGVLVLSSCTEGTCGTCETVVIEGEVDHRDSILTPAERARNDVMYVCVSRAACPRLVLDL